VFEDDVIEIGPDVTYIECMFADCVITGSGGRFGGCHFNRCDFSQYAPTGVFRVSFFLDCLKDGRLFPQDGEIN